MSLLSQNVNIITLSVITDINNFENSYLLYHMRCFLCFSCKSWHNGVSNALIPHQKITSTFVFSDKSISHIMVSLQHVLMKTENIWLHGKILRCNRKMHPSFILPQRASNFGLDNCFFIVLLFLLEFVLLSANLDLIRARYLLLKKMTTIFIIWLLIADFNLIYKIHQVLSLYKDVW